jgi:hypothetical protein
MSEIISNTDQMPQREQTVVRGSISVTKGNNP